MSNLIEQEPNGFKEQKDTGNQALEFLMEDFRRLFPDSIATQQTLKTLSATGLVQRQYLVDGYWFTGKPPGKPEATKVVFSSAPSFRVFDDVVSFWNFSSRSFAYSPKRPEVILERMIEKRLSQNELLLFTPWGSIPGNTTVGTQELEAMKILQNIKSQCWDANIQARVLIMPADVYAMEINQRPKNETVQYFVEVNKLAESFGFSVQPWSFIKRKFSQIYSYYASKFTDETLNQLLPKQLIWQAIKQAKRWSGYTKPDQIQKSAYAYMRERLIEDSIIDSQYQPIKLSAVAPAKDALDFRLPILYVIDADAQFPWIPYNLRRAPNDNNNLFR